MANHYTLGIGDNGVYLVDSETPNGRYSCRKITHAQRVELLAGLVEPQDVKGRRVRVSNLHLAPECQIGIEECRAMGPDAFLLPAS